MRSLLLLTVVIQASVPARFQEDVAKAMALFVSSNSAKSVTLNCPGTTALSLCKGLYTTLANVHLVPTRYLAKTEDCLSSHEDFHVVSLASVHPPDIVASLHFIADRKTKSSLLYFPKDFTEDEWILLRQLLAGLNRNSHFYLALGTGVLLSFNVVVTLKHQVGASINKITFLEGSYTIKESYDLEGLHVTSISESLRPYVSFEDCDDDHLECATIEGMLVDHCEQIGRMMNFSIVHYRQPDGNWGTVPVDGPYNLSGTWSGIQGAIIYGSHQMSLSSYVALLERIDLMDFLPLANHAVSLFVMRPQPLDLDFGVFLRPFTSELWKATLSVTSVALVGLVLPPLCLPHFRMTQGFQIATTTMWYMFIVLNAYFGGALTMFFSTEQPLPFNSAIDALRGYPDWKVMIRRGNEVEFAVKAEQGHQDYVRFWQRIQETPEETMYESIADGLENIRGQRVIIHVMEEPLREFFRENPQHQKGIRVFGRGRSASGNIILVKNSPLLPVLQLGMRRLQESGVGDLIRHRWLGRPISPKSMAVSTPAISIGQISLVLVTMTGTLVVALLCLCLEVSWTALNHHWTRKSSQTLIK